MAIQQTLLLKSVTNWCRPPHPSAGWVSHSGRIQGTIVRQRVDRMLKTGPAHMFILKDAKKTAKVKGSIHVNSCPGPWSPVERGRWCFLKQLCPEWNLILLTRPHLPFHVYWQLEICGPWHSSACLFILLKRANHAHIMSLSENSLSSFASAILSREPLTTFTMHHRQSR